MQPLDQSLTIGDEKEEYAEFNPEYRGQKLDPSLANGPSQDRKCTDLLCCVLFAAFLGGFVGIAILAFEKGDPVLLTAPFDSTGQQCGVSPGYKEYKYVYFNNFNTSQFCCINECPNPAPGNSTLCWWDNAALDCNLFGQYPTSRQIDICYPSNSTIAETMDIALGMVDMMISDIDLVWPISLSVAGIAFILSFIMLWVVRGIGGCLIWGTIVLYFVGLTIFGFVSYFMSQKLAEESNLHNPQAFKIIAYCCWSVVGMSLIVFLCTFSKLKIAIMVIKAAADFIKTNCYIVVVPILMFVVAVLWIGFWMTDSIYLFSSGTPSSCGSSPYSCVNWNKSIRSLLVYNIFTLFWVCEFLISLSQYVICSTAAMWYFSTSTKITRALCYHIGSLAFGALVLLLVLILQVFMGAFHWVMKDSTLKNKNATNGCMKCCMGCSLCCISCFQRFIRFLTRNAFIMMAVTGQSFCKSAHHAFYLSIRIAQSYAITNGVSHVIMVFIKLLVTGACTVMGFFMITGIPMFSEELFQPVLPCVMFVVISYVISSLFMDVLGLSADTLLYCYSIELDLHGGSVKSCPPGFMEFIQQYR